MQQEQKTYKVMEWHRGEFIPLKATNPDGSKGDDKTVKITSESADELNRNFSKKRGQGVQIKYILSEEQPKNKKEVSSGKKELQDEYKEVSGKKPYHAWTEEELIEKINQHKTES